MGKINFQYAVFEKSSKYGVYDVVQPKGKFPFTFLKIEKPKSDYFLNNGVTDVVMSWNNLKGKSKEKILHTGLIPIAKSYLFGNNLKANNKKDFILIYFDKVKVQIHFFLVKNRCPKKKTDFALELVSHFKSLGYNI